MTLLTSRQLIAGRALPSFFLSDTLLTHYFWSKGSALFIGRVSVRPVEGDAPLFVETLRCLLLFASGRAYYVFCFELILTTTAFFHHFLFPHHFDFEGRLASKYIRRTVHYYLLLTTSVLSVSLILFM